MNIDDFNKEKDLTKQINLRFVVVFDQTGFLFLFKAYVQKVEVDF